MGRLDNGEYMSMPQVSVIIPAYNTKERIKDCIDSVMKQKFRDFELIIIDDGSTDGTGEICDQYRKNEKIKVIHTENNGRIQARKKGVTMSKGKYLSFLDSDDYLHEDFLYNMYSAAEESCADIVESGFMRVNGVRQENDCTTLRTGIYDKKQIREEILPWMFLRDRGGKNIQPSLCDKLFNRDFFIKNVLDVPSNCSNGEDGAITYGLMMFCERYVILNQPLYYYVQYRQEHKYVYKRSYTVELEELLDYYESNECFTPYINQILIYISEIMLSHFFMICGISFREDFEYLVNNNFVKRICKSVHLKDCKSKQKIILFLIKAKCFTLLSVMLRMRLRAKRKAI